MLPVSLTESQENIPSLNEEQLQAIGMRNNHEWKLNATMLGFTKGEDPNDFIESKKNINIKTYTKGVQVALFRVETSSSLSYPIAIEGDFIIKEEYERSNGEWQVHDLFSHENGLFLCHGLPDGFTGATRILYGKYLHREEKKESVEKEEFDTSCENITKTLKEIDQKKKELEFISTNNSSFKNDRNERKYRVILNSRDGSRVN